MKAYLSRLSAAERKRLEESAERVRRAVPPAERAERTGVVYDVAALMCAVPVPGDEIRLVFTAMAWAEEHQ